MIQEIDYFVSTTSGDAKSIRKRWLFDGSAPDIEPGQLPFDLELCGVPPGGIPRPSGESVGSSLIEDICQGLIALQTDEDTILD